MEPTRRLVARMGLLGVLPALALPTRADAAFPGNDSRWSIAW